MKIEMLRNYLFQLECVKDLSFNYQICINMNSQANTFNNLDQNEHSDEQRQIVQVQTKKLHQKAAAPSNSSQTQCLVVVGMLLVTILLYLYITSTSPQSTIPSQQVTPLIKQPTTSKPKLTTTVKTPSRPPLPKILWIYTYHKWEGETAMNRIMVHYFNHTGALNGYDVRIVDSWTAYDWLSPGTIQKITKAIQNVKIDETVCSLLKMALLMEHGGILISNLHFIMIQKNFNWIQQMFQEEGDSSMLKIDPGMAQVYVPLAHPIQSYNYYFNQHIYAAVPHSRFITETFQQLQQIIITGSCPFNEVFGFFRHNNDVNIDYIPFSIASAMTAIIYNLSLSPIIIDPHKHYAIQGKKQWNFIQFKELNIEQSYKVLRQKNRLMKDKDLVLNTHDRILDFVDMLLIDNYFEPIEKTCLLYFVLSAPENEKVFLKPWPKRQISLCGVVIEDLSTQIESTYQTFQKQNFKNKQLIVFTSDPSKSLNLPGLTVLKTSGNQVRNIEIALTQHCKHGGYAVLLRKGEQFSKNNALEMIAETVKDRSVIGASINLVVGNSTYSAKPEYHNYSRSRDGVLNPKLEIMNGIINHLRVISIDAFRYIPQFELRDPYGVYFEDRIIILSTLLEMLAPQEKVRSKQHRHKYLYLKRYYTDIFHFPNTTAIVDPSIYIKTSSYEETSQAQIVKTKVRYDVESLELSMVNNELWGVPFSKQLVFNKGKQYVSMTQKKGPELIPKVIHQAWLGGQMPYAKKYFWDKTKRLHPNYEMVLWRTENITRQNFPVSYDIMQTLLTYQKSGKSAYSKFATVTDLLRHQLMYKNGGFWRDAGMNLFKNVFDHFTKYKLVIGSEATFAHRWDQGMCFFANEPRSQNLLRVSSYQNVNRMRFYHAWAVTIAGPIDFRQVVIGDQESSPDILMIHYEYYYPAQAGHYPFGDQCLKKREQFKEGDPYVFEYKGYVFLPDCQKFYPLAFGQDHNMFGISWQGKQ